MKKINWSAALVVGLALSALVGCASTSTREGTGEYFDDSVITSKVKAAIFNEPTLSSNQIGVETFKGTVQLSGFVGSQAEIDKAGAIARDVKGVTSVQNGISLKVSSNPAPLVAAAPLAPAAPVVVVAPAVAEKVIVTAGTMFDFDKSVIKPAGKETLDALVGKLEGNLRLVISTGHTDAIGSDAYNQDLSLRRAEAVKAYLVAKGIDGNRIETVGKGNLEPIAAGATAVERAKDRRVEIEVKNTL